MTGDDQNTDLQTDNTGGNPGASSSVPIDDNNITPTYQQLPEEYSSANTNNTVSDMDDSDTDTTDISGLNSPSQSGHNMPQDKDPDLDKDLTEEELEGTRYQTPTEDENDIERAADRNTEFRGIRDTEMTDSKTHMHPEDKQLVIQGFSSGSVSSSNDDDDDDDNNNNAALVVDRSMDSQEMDSLDPGLEAWAPDTGDDTTGRVNNMGSDLSDFRVIDDAIDEPDELANE